MRDRIDAAIRRGGHGQAVTIVAVTKTHGPDAVQAAWNAGLGDVGENRVQEAVPKMDVISAPVRWHLIGHLQRNKVKALPRFELLHSLDSSRLADAVGEVGLAAEHPINALVQVNVVGEETKGGFSREQWSGEAERLHGLGGIRVRGVMTMAPLVADERTLRLAFAGAREAGDVFRAAGHAATELSMGMSNDYEVAVEEGATIVRLGTVFFGARPA
ncbi:MAG TPA: YggS family pyridoxal phosphate-dependent enzyme [Gemmatimonadaceae bacterium]|nr:YggS family pyridoxal phosphate-dependent enzyme [Gemmatimonadaceae bacterium]